MDPLVKDALDTLARDLARSAKRAEVRGILKLCRSRGELINYVDIAKPLGMFSGGSELATVLGDLMKEAYDAGEAPLSALVVRTDTGMPGEGFFDYARELGHDVKDERRFWEEQLRRLGLEVRVGDLVVEEHDGERKVIIRRRSRL